MRSRLLPLLGLLACGAVVPAPARGEPIERVLAVVDRKPILLSEVRVVEVLRAVDRLTAVGVLVDETLMYAEATRFSHAQPTPREDAAAFESLRAAVPSGASIAEADLRRLAHRQATILKYVALRFQPLIRLTDEERRPDLGQPLGGTPAAVPSEPLAADLPARTTREVLDRRIEEWAEQLRESAEIRYVVDEPAGF
jgi:hypothetical protein